MKPLILLLLSLVFISNVFAVESYSVLGCKTAARRLVKNIMKKNDESVYYALKETWPGNRIRGYRYSFNIEDTRRTDDYIVVGYRIQYSYKVCDYNCTERKSYDRYNFSYVSIRDEDGVGCKVGL